MNKSYVVCFAFNEDGNVWLIKKNRPEWQKGKFNGIGGHIEEGETPVQAATREFHEETGVVVEQEKWLPFCEMKSDDWACYCFTANNITGCKTTTDEEVLLIDSHHLDRDTTGFLPVEVLPNLHWLIPMAKTGNVQAEVYYHDKK